MPKSRNRKKKKICKQVDRAGNLSNSHTPKHNKDAGRRIMYRNMLFQDAGKSLSIEEIEELINKVKDREASLETIKPPKPIMSYVQTRLDKEGVPVEAKTVSITISNADVSRLETVLTLKKSEKETAEAKQSEKS